MKHIWMIGLIALISQAAAAQWVADSIEVDGHYRVFHFRPPSAGVKPPSLVFVLHGSDGNGLGMVNATAKLAERSEAEHFLLVYPDGYKRYWNECRKYAPSAANLENINEEGFFSAMIAYFNTKYGASDKNVFAVGSSGGGHMAYKLGLTMPGRFRAISAIVANLPDTGSIDCVGSNKPIPVMIANGTLDPTNKYEGGPVIMGNGINMGLVRSTERTFRYWASLAGYSGEPVKTNIPDADPSDGKTVERYTFKKKGKPEIVLLKVIGGKHDYPNDIDVFVESWTFFKRQKK